ncbi:MAG TPA: hypothetical protein VHZ32_14105 [Rhizomicrobium sp.]|nr:hypothetical protein [Rhizomicrobium sp.]
MIASTLEWQVRLKDFVKARYPDPGAPAAIAACLAWLAAAQDHSTTADGGVARHYSLKTGWGSSYPETTGYIAATLLDGRHDPGLRESRARAIRMLDWFTRIQFPEGGFQGGMVDQQPRVPVTFNTGQILIGLAAGAGQNTLYKEAMTRAADWLAATQDGDGCWRRFPTPFARPGEKTYETHVALGLFAAHAVDPARGWQAAGLRQVDWALRNQQANGWLAKCCLEDEAHPLTHTLGYALRGIVGAYESAGGKRHLDAAIRTADGLLSCQQKDGRLAGRYDSQWRPCTSWVCLTGVSQIAESWLLLSRLAGRRDYAEAGRRANAFVRRTIRLYGHHSIRGGVKGSLPIGGGYGRLQYLNWAAKFTIDANRAELVLQDTMGAEPGREG